MQQSAQHAARAVLTSASSSSASSSPRSIARAAATFCTRCRQPDWVERATSSAARGGKQRAAQIPQQQSQRRTYASAAPLPSPLRHPEYSHRRTSKGDNGSGADSSSYSVSLPRSKASGYGQPLPSTHPHLLEHGQLTEGIPAAEYASRRKQLMDMLPDGSVVVLPGGRLQYSSQSIFYKFRQLSDFFYLTGWLEPDAAVILEKTPSTKQGYKMTFFCQSRDPDRELWDGPRNGPNGAVDIFGADQALDIAHFTSHLKTLLTTDNRSGTIYVDIPDSPTSSIRAPRGVTKAAKSVINFLKPADSSPTFRKNTLDLSMASKKSDYDALTALLSGTNGRTVKSLKEITEGMRMLKSENEIRVMRRAADISGDAHAQVMKLARPGINEHTLVSTFEYHCAINGSQRPAYMPVCGSGPNTQYLHYTANNCLLPENALVLIDAGCEYGGYASDITRTFPTSGRFSEPEKDLYTAVLNTVKKCIRSCTEEADVNLYALHELSRTVLLEELKQVGLDLSGNEALFGAVYPHFVGHPLGIDLHDCPTFQRHTRLEAGNVITIEPGVLMPDHPSIPKHFQNIAVRLEEEVLIGKRDPVILSVNAPIEIADVEACCQKLLDRTE